MKKKNKKKNKKLQNKKIQKIQTKPKTLQHYKTISTIPHTTISIIVQK